MAIVLGYLVGLSEAYPEEQNPSLNSLLEGIPRDLLLMVGSGLMADQKGRERIKDFIERWFRPENTAFANDAYSRLEKFEKKHGQLIVAGPPQILKLFVYAYNHLTNEKKLTDEQIEVNLFKSFLLLNDFINKTELKINETTKGLPFDLQLPAMHFSNLVRFSDIVNYDLYELFVTEFIRAILFFEFLVKRDECRVLLSEFYRIYGVLDWTEYIQRISGLSFAIFKKTNGGFLDLVITRDEKFERDVKFLDTLALVPYDELSDNDFKAVRERPLHKIEDGKYRIISDLFCVERIFKGLYFNLKAINQTLAMADRVKDLRKLYTFEFSEKHALYTMLNKSFPKKFVRISGEEMFSKGYQGGPDFYVRNTNKTFLFESKDSLINAVIKETGDYAKLSEDLSSKFYKDGTSPKAVMQLLNNVIAMLQGKFSIFDKDYNTRFIRVYPIVVIHDRQLDVPGFNKLLNNWFRTELRKQSQVIDISRVLPITVIDTATLILIHELLIARQLLLEEVIEKYHHFVTLRKSYASEHQRARHAHDTNITFSNFVKNIIAARGLKRYPENFLMEKAFIALGD